MTEDSRIAPSSSSSTGTRLNGLSSRRRAGRRAGWISTSSTGTPFSANAARTFPENGEVRNVHRRGVSTVLIGVGADPTRRRQPARTRSERGSYSGSRVTVPGTQVPNTSTSTLVSRATSGGR